MGTAGSRVAGMDASEASAGNISALLGWPVEVRRRFPLNEQLDLPAPVPDLAGKTMLVTGSGRRLRDIRRDPEANVGAVVVASDGLTATLHTSPRRLFAHLTSEFNSHIAVHQQQVAERGIAFQAIVHAQPPHLTFLSHIPAMRDEAEFNRRVLRWEPESIVALPQGIAVLDFMVPGSPMLMAANVEALRTRQIVLWGKHGVMARSDASITNAVDRIEYAETGARYEYMNLMSGGLAEGLTHAELERVVAAFHVETELV
ncbi:MAG: class II aldolase/adducin family protein [Actinobacteria bacterium]|nr:class II aldolase/adducin family protein [Actinomycetota bacterium]